MSAYTQAPIAPALATAQTAPFLPESPFHAFYQAHKTEIEESEDTSQHNYVGIINRGD